MNILICSRVSPKNMQTPVLRRDVENIFVIINLPLRDPCIACILLQLNCRMEQATSTITLKCQLNCMLKLAMQLIICMLQDSGTQFPHLKSVNLSMLNSSVKKDVYQLRGLYHAGNEPCTVIIKHIVPPDIFQVRLSLCYWNTTKEPWIMLEIYYEIFMLVPLTYIAVVIHLCCIRMFSSLLPFDVITAAMDLRLLMLTVSAEMLFNVLWCDSFGGNFMELLQHFLHWVESVIQCCLWQVIFRNIWLLNAAIDNQESTILESCVIFKQL